MDFPYIDSNTSMDFPPVEHVFIHSTPDYFFPRLSNHSNLTRYYYDRGINKFAFDMKMAKFVVVGFGLFVTLLALFAVFSLVKRNQPAPIFVINLLVSDVVQLCCMIPYLVTNKVIYLYAYIIGVACGVGFMVCVSMERYLIVAWPLWYRFRRTIKTYVLICVVVWVAPIIIVAASFPCLSDNITSIIMGVFLLLPFPLLIFFLVGTLKAMSSAISVPDVEKRRIAAISVLMLLIYTLLFLPIILTMLIINNDVLSVMVPFFTSISPLADSVLYILLRKSVSDKVFTLCCKISNNKQTNNIDDGHSEVPDIPV